MEIRKYLTLNENENTTHENLLDAARAIIRMKFIPVNIYIKREKITNQ